MKTPCMLERFQVTADVTDLRIYDTPLRFVSQRDHNVLLSHGLHPDEGAILVDTTTDLSREQVDTYHDYCLFATGPHFDDNWYEQQAAALALELRAQNLAIPAKDHIFHVVGAHHPASRSFAILLNDRLIFT